MNWCNTIIFSYCLSHYCYHY